MHWKLIVGYIVTPVLCLTLFSWVSYKIYYSTAPIPDGVYIFDILFGSIGFTIFFTIILRAKTIEIKKSEIILSRRFSPISCALKPENIESYS